jgi:16S rRNA (uracil1498-N3)-methyltransferase
VARAVRVLVDGLQSGRCTLAAEAAHYVTRVHRLRVGQGLVLADPALGLEAQASLLSVGKSVEVEVGPLSPGLRRGVSELQLMWGIGKGDKLDDVLKSAVALGAGRLCLVETARSVPRVQAAADRKRERWLAIAQDAMRQSERADPLALMGPLNLREALSHDPECERLVLQPDAAARPLLELLRSCKDKVTASRPLQLWVGPEGGFSDDELELLRAQGATLADLGPLILRTEVAVNSALALAAAVLRSP